MGLPIPDRVAELLAIMRDNYGQHTEDEWRSFVNETEIALIERLLALFHEQNAEIDRMCAGECSCGSQCSLASKEMCYIESGELIKFYREHPAIDNAALESVWTKFAALLTFSLHARALSLCLGHIPTNEELLGDQKCILISRGWQARERRRFHPDEE